MVSDLSGLAKFGQAKGNLPARTSGSTLTNLIHLLLQKQAKRQKPKMIPAPYIYHVNNINWIIHSSRSIFTLRRLMQTGIVLCVEILIWNDLRIFLKDLKERLLNLTTSKLANPCTVHHFLFRTKFQFSWKLRRSNLSTLNKTGEK